MKTDVLVLGAGVAGLAAAHAIRAKGAEVAVIEARDRLGGRVHTLRDAAWPHPVELGAEFLHGKPRKLGIPKRWRLGLHRAEGEHWSVVNGRLARMDWSEDDPDDPTALLARMKGPELTADAWLKKNGPRGRKGKLARLFVQGFYAADPRVVSTSFLARETEVAEEVGSESAYRPTNGYDLVPRALAKGLTVYQSTTVKSVRWRRGHVEVTASDAGGKSHRFAARSAIIALPIAVLQARGAITIRPMPEGLGEAIRKLRVGPIVKVLLRFRAPFWEATKAKRFTFVHATGQAVPVWWRPVPFDSNVLVGWAAGPQGNKLSGLPRAQALRGALRSLEHAFGLKDLASWLDGYEIIDWTTDRYARGGYVYVPVGLEESYPKMFLPVRDTLYFAGEHTQVEGHTGTVHGALWSGERAAKQWAAAHR